MRQVILVRKDLNMSSGKVAAQVSHASMAFLAAQIREKAVLQDTGYTASIDIPANVYEDWFMGVLVKTVCEARNRYQLMRAMWLAEDLGLQEDRDFFLMRDYCLTETEPEETDEDGKGRTLTCIGFRPLPDEIAHQISYKYHLYR